MYMILFGILLEEKRIDNPTELSCLGWVFFGFFFMLYNSISQDNFEY